MAIERFDFDDPRSQKFRAVTRRVLILGVVCLVLMVMMVAVVATVLLTAENDTRQQVKAAALLGNSMPTYVNMTRLWSFSTQGARSTASFLGSVGLSGVTTTVSVSTDTYHIRSSLIILQQSATSSSTVIQLPNVLYSSSESSSESSLSSLTYATSPLSLSLDTKPSRTVENTQHLTPVMQSSVFNLTSTSLFPSELSVFVTMVTNPMMSSASSMEMISTEHPPSSLHLTSIVASDMTSFSRSDVRSPVYSTQHYMSSKSPLESSAGSSHTSENASSTSDNLISSFKTHMSQTSEELVLSSSSGSFSPSEKVEATSANISDSLLRDVSISMSRSIKSSSRHLMSSTSHQEAVSTSLLPTSQMSMSLVSYPPTPLQSSMTFYPVTTTPIILESTHPISAIVPSPTSVLSSWVGRNEGQGTTQPQSSVNHTLLVEETTLLYSSERSGTTTSTAASTVTTTSASTAAVTTTSTFTSITAVTTTTTEPTATTSTSTAAVTTTTTEPTTMTTNLTSTTTSTTAATEPATTVDSRCPADQAPCEDGTCLLASKFCDGVVNCPDASDEAKDCSCGSGQFKCRSGQCVSSLARCDRHPHCRDKTDEFNCSGCLGFQCDSGLCLWTHSSRCNQVVDCEDLSDELRCPFRPGYKQCSNGIFIQASDWCDGVDDCYDNSDETQCECEPLTETACQDGGCIRREWMCDGVLDCRNGTDEENCDRCSSTEFVCPDYQCVAIDTVCDGHRDCSGGEDELGCFSLSTVDHSGLSLTTGQLWVQYSHQVQPLCSSHWTQQLSDHMCLHLGHGKAIQTTYTPETSSPQNSYFELKSDVMVSGISHILGNFINVTNCSSGSLINISCSNKECGKRSEDFLTAYIAGGELSPLGKWPWVASLMYLGEPLCTASIVTSQWLVTAGHCVALPGAHDYTHTPFYVQASAGSVKRFTDQRSRSNMVAADRILQHPNFTYTGLGSILWDIALVHLERPLTFTEVIQPICLPMDADSYHDNCYLAGWGFLDNDGGHLPQYLREAKVQVWEDETCRQDTVPLETSVNTNITLCTGYAGGILSGCQGDSGSPLMCEDARGHWFLAGVLSSGSANCGVVTTRADRYTRVSALRKWINDVIVTP